MIKIKNWSSYQSYKDRKPPWIRFHKTMLDNYEYHSMSAEARALLPMFWLLASENEDPVSGEIHSSLDKIAFRLRTTIQTLKKSITELEKSGFLISNVSHKERAKSDCVYFLLNEATNEVKIGYSSQFEWRKIRLENGENEKLRILAILNGGDRKQENIYHKKFEQFKTKRNEWYTFSDEIRDECNAIVTNSYRNGYDFVTPETEKRQRREETDIKSNQGPTPKPIDILNLWNKTITKSLPRVQFLNPQRTQRLKTQIKQMPKTDDWLELFMKINASDFLSGRAEVRGERKWQCTFDWAIKSTSITKILEGNYDNKQKSYGHYPKQQSLGRDAGQMGSVPNLLGGIQSPGPKK